MEQHSESPPGDSIDQPAKAGEPVTKAVRRVVFTGAVGVMLLWMLVAAYVMQGLRWSRISALAQLRCAGLLDRDGQRPAVTRQP